MEQILGVAGKSKMLKKNAALIANSVDLDQTAPFRSSLTRVFTVCSDASVPKLSEITRSTSFCAV